MKDTDGTTCYWWKWRQRMSSGYDKWQYIFSYVKTAEQLEELLDDGRTLSTWSEHYRGIDVQKVSRPPKQYLLEKIAYLRDRAEDLIKEAAKFKMMFDKWYGEK